MIKYDLNKLDWNNPTIKKNWCLANTKRLFGMIEVNMGPDAATALKYCDKFSMEDIDIGDVLVIGRNNTCIGGASTPYGHIGVVTEITDTYLIMNDGNNAYPRLKIVKNKLKNDKWGVITPLKMIELGATMIKKEDLYLNITEIMINYKEIFDKEFGKSTIFSDLEGASKNLNSPEQIAYFVAIGLERLNKRIEELKK